MRKSTWSIQDAKNNFSAIVKAAEREPQTVTKHGNPAVVVMAADEYDRLRALRRMKAPTFVDHLLAMPQDDGSFQRLGGKLRNPGVSGESDA
jgi:prevent-host-death family protein